MAIKRQGNDYRISPAHFVRGKKTRQTEEQVERQHQGMDRPGVWHVPEGGGENWLQNHLWCPNDPRG